MGISVSEELVQPVLTADAIRNTLPQVCLTDDGSPKSEGSIKNILAGFNQMLKAGLLDESRLAEQMESGFKLTQSQVRHHAKLENKSSWPSFLNDVRAAANEIINFDTSNMTFAQTLTVLAGKKFGTSLSKTKLSQLIHQLEPSVSSSAIYMWMTGEKKPRVKRTIDAVISLDKKLSANGDLSKKVKKFLIVYELNEDVKNKNRTFVLPDLLKKELDEYINFRVHSLKPKKMSYLENEVPKNKDEKRRINQLKKIDNTEWSKGTAIAFPRAVTFFARYIQTEYPEKFKSMSLSTFFNSDIIENFEGYVVNKGTFAVANTIFGWIRSESIKNSYASVYLHSDDEFCLNTQDWIEELELLKSDVVFILNRIKKKYEKLDGARNVEWILDKDNPIPYVNIIAKSLWAETEYAATPMAPAMAAMLFDMLIPCPIRAKNVNDLRWAGRLSEKDVRDLYKTSTCALYFDIKKNCHVIFVHKNELKNRKSTTIKSIIQPLRHLSTKFTNYLSIRESFIQYKNWDTDILFPMQKIAKNIKASRLDNLGNIIDFRMGSDGISSLFSRATKGVIDTYFPEEMVTIGVNLHAMRHLSASLYLRGNADNYTGLATLLMDNLETVTRIYARRDDIGNHERIADWSAKMMEE